MPFLIAVAVVVLGAVGVLVARRRRREWRLPTIRPASSVTDSTTLRVLDGDDPAPSHHEPSRPRVDPLRPLVFGDDLLDEHVTPSASGRHGDRWALERSAHRGRVSFASWRVIAIAVVALIVLFGVGVLVSHGSPAGHGHPTTTTTTAG